MKVTDEMVTRFLGWKLPQDFAPDCGISFDGRKPDQYNPSREWPVGTNLLTATQARAMLEYVLGDETTWQRNRLAPRRHPRPPLLPAQQRARVALARAHELGSSAFNLSRAAGLCGASRSRAGGCGSGGHGTTTGGSG